MEILRMRTARTLLIPSMHRTVKNSVLSYRLVLVVWGSIYKQLMSAFFMTVIGTLNKIYKHKIAATDWGRRSL